MDIEKIINEEIEAYFAINGNIGGWGEDMNDGIAIDIILDNILSGYDIDDITPEIEAMVRSKLQEMKTNNSNQNE